MYLSAAAVTDCTFAPRSSASAISDGAGRSSRRRLPLPLGAPPPRGHSCTTLSRIAGVVPPQSSWTKTQHPGVSGGFGHGISGGGGLGDGLGGGGDGSGGEGIGGGGGSGGGGDGPAS